MSLTDLLMAELPNIPLRRLGSEQEAGLWITSLPWPRTQAKELSLGDKPTWVSGLGQWPGEAEGSPRRLLMIADGGNEAPDTIGLGESAPYQAGPPTAECEVFATPPEEDIMWERSLLRISDGERAVGLVMGLRHGGEVHWWEGCRLVVLEDSPQCRVVEMGGSIPCEAYAVRDPEQMGYAHPLLHRHNWLSGHIFARLHANGVCEIFAHHINSKFFDDGEDLEDTVPVIGIMVDGADGEMTEVTGTWTGECDGMELGGVRFDLSEASGMATPDEPGSMEIADGFLAWQPYEGACLYSGNWARQTTGDAFILRPQDHRFPRGLARTVRFSLSLSDRSPRVVRYLAPAWWYGLCEELIPEPVLPVSNAYDQTLESCREYARVYTTNGGFEDGALPRGGNPNPKPEDNGRSEAGWEGEAPWALFLLAWLSGNGEDYDNAMRAAWHFTDVAIDHAEKLVRMHGWARHAFAPPMNRVLGTVAAYLEVGDPYLLEAAQAVVDNAHWVQKNSWPRLAVGRDGKYVRSATMLYRYFADEHYRRIAYEGATMVAHSQRPNGSFGDQGGGSGIHQVGSYITKPWMGLMATEGVLDYLELFPGDEVLMATVQRFADWLMAERFDHDGVMGWSYQHDFDGKRRYFDGHGGKWWDLPGPSKAMWHQNSLGRLLGYCTLHTGDPSYLDAWAESYAASPGASGDHGVATSGHPIPWLQCKLWQPELTDEGVRIRPVQFGPRTEKCATILTPAGPVAVAWDDSGEVAAPDGVIVER